MSRTVLQALVGGGRGGQPPGVRAGKRPRRPGACRKLLRAAWGMQRVAPKQLDALACSLPCAPEPAPMIQG
eukprot:9387687-Alexandrium_andersonii.AAC.1